MGYISVQYNIIYDAVRLSPHKSLCGSACHRGLSWAPYCSSYTASLINPIERYGPHRHLYATDMQIQDFCHPRSANQLQSTLSACLDEVSEWMRSNQLQLNNAKTEIHWQWCLTTHQ